MDPTELPIEFNTIFGLLFIYLRVNASVIVIFIIVFISILCKYSLARLLYVDFVVVVVVGGGGVGVSFIFHTQSLK